MDVEKAKEYNLEQISHIMLLQRFVFQFCERLMGEVFQHDASKFEEDEYEAFVEAKDTLNASKDGKDFGYQTALMSEAIQHHITSNPHHPEYWTKKGEEMPVDQAIIMFFDWLSRSFQRKTSMEDYWEFNTAKLKNHATALSIVTSLKKIYD